MTMFLRLTSLAACSFTLSLLLAACGGKTFESESDTSGVQGAGADAGNGGADDAPGEPSADDGAPDEPAQDDSPAVEPTSDDTGGGTQPSPDPTTTPGPTTPGPTTGEPMQPGPSECPNACPVIALCKLCADGSCGTPKISCNPDGSCGETTFVCPEDTADPTEPQPTDPGPTDPVEPVDPADYQPCLDKSCGDECDACAPGLQCLIGAGYCNAEGSCLPAEPECGGEPVEPSPGCNCPVTDVCMLCDDGSCASAVPECDADGACVGTQWTCPDEPVAECKTEKDCASLEGCLQCDNGEEWCPHSVCRQGECGTSPNLCPESYEPCAGKEEGEACQNCSPLDPACAETDEIKSCQDGSCKGGSPR